MPGRLDLLICQSKQVRPVMSWYDMRARRSMPGSLLYHQPTSLALMVCFDRLKCRLASSWHAESCCRHRFLEIQYLHSELTSKLYGKVWNNPIKEIAHIWQIESFHLSRNVSLFVKTRPSWLELRKRPTTLLLKYILNSLGSTSVGIGNEDRWNLVFSLLFPAAEGERELNLKWALAD